MSETIFKTSSFYLDNERKIPVTPAVARLFGERKALIIQQVRYWMDTYEKADKRENFREGRWWVWMTYKRWAESVLDWLGEGTITRDIRELEKQGVFVSREFNKAAGDRVKWYTIDFDVLDYLVTDNEAHWQERREERRVAKRIATIKGRTPSSQPDQMGGASSQPDQMPSDQPDQIHKTIKSSQSINNSGASAEGDNLRPRNLAFDVIATRGFGVKLDNKAQVEAAGGRIAKCLSRARKLKQDVTADDLTRFYEWLQRSYPQLSPPRDADKFGERFAEWLSLPVSSAPAVDEAYMAWQRQQEEQLRDLYGDHHAA